MGDKTAIEWTDKTWNPWRGCIKVSTGCKHCYMYRDQMRYGRNPKQVVRSKTTFRDPLKWDKPALVFTCSLSDFFIEDADNWRDEAWAIIRDTPQLTYQILTKRPENVRARLPRDWENGYPNVWLGVSAEDQRNADRRVPVLLSIPARVRFVSAEPLLAPIDFEPYFAWTDYDDYYGNTDYPGVDWVIVGGESGPHQRDPKSRRPMEMEWARAIRDQCVEFGVPFFFKQNWHVKPGRESFILEDNWMRTVWHQWPETS